MKLRNKKTGEIVVFVGTYCKNDRVFFRLEDEKGVFKREIHSLNELNGEWEDYEEPKPSYHWFISGRGTIEYEKNDDDCFNREHKSMGNYFETKEEAEKAVEKLKAWKRLKDKGFEFCGYEALGCGEIHFTSDWDIEDEYEKGQRRKDLDLLFGGEE